MPSTNLGVCNTCQKRVPVGHVVRDGRVFIRKECSDCGPTEALLSTNAVIWQSKRDLCRFDPDAPIPCTLRCETCGRSHNLRMVFLDVTNRCNMNCPICIANIPGMGFEFHPPIEYFEHVFAGLAQMTPKPVVQLFGGEPTMRDDLFDIIGLARQNGLDVRLVTNGLRLADEEYCRKLCELKVHILLAFDGRDPEIYERLRRSKGAYEKKLKALENLKKYNRFKNTLMVCVARKINDRHIRDLIDFCHENQSYIKFMHCIPLTETWKEGEFETDIATTIEAVEQIIGEAFPGETVEFIPAGLTQHLDPLAVFFGSPLQKFGGVHPNCESLTYLVSDGRQYWPVAHFLRRPVTQLLDDVIARAARISPRLARLDRTRKWQRFKGQMLILRTFRSLAVHALDFRKVLKGNRFFTSLRFVGGLIIGRRMKHLLRKYTNLQGTMGIVILPFEEYHSIEAARLMDCPSAFAYEDPDTGDIKAIPVCIWRLYKDGIMRRIQAKYAGSPAAAAAGASVGRGADGAEA